MKKILFATTALVATAGVAAADVAVSGSAAFGVLKFAGQDAFIGARVDLNFTGTTETDGGVALSASVDFDGAQTFAGYTGGATPYTSATSYNTLNDTPDVVFTAEAGALTFAFGDTDGALDARTTELHRLVGFNLEGWTVGLDNDDSGAIARVDYSIGDVALSMSYAGADDAFGIGASYNADLGSVVLALGAGYETGNPAGDSWAISAGTTFGAFSVRANYGDMELDGEVWGLSGQYSADGITIGANYFEMPAGNGYTLFGTYDLGGGAQAFAQYGDSVPGSFSTTGGKFASAGVSFAF